MKKVMLIGKTGCGKTTLSQALQKELITYKKTQAVEYYKNIIDTPGEYIENRVYYNALIVSSYDCDIIALVQDCTSDENFFPPNFSAIFCKPVIGIITKVDLCSCDKNIHIAMNYLINSGVSEIFKVSSINNEGIDKIREILQ